MNEYATDPAAQAESAADNDARNAGAAVKTMKHGTLLASAIASALALAPAGAMAQNAGEEDDSAAVVEEIVVTGFRSSLLSAINIKRSADQVKESLAAEDIGRLPDISIAESLARLPGVTAQRTGGQAGALNIRGLDQGLILSTLNGREQVATSGGRAIDFSQYPSELIAGADVYKSPEAKQIEGGLAGTVALKLARPLDISRDLDHTFAANLRGAFNDRAGDSVDSDDNGYRASLTYQGVFADETVGLTLGYARLVQPNVESRFGSDIFTQTGTDNDGNGVNDFIAFRYSAEELGGEDVRDGFVLGLQWRPSDSFDLAFDSYYSDFESTGFARGVTIVGPQTVGGGTVLTNAVVQNDVIVGGTFTRTAASANSPILDGSDPFSTASCCGGFAITPSSDTQTRDFDNQLLTLGLTGTVYAGPWTFKGDVSYSESEAFAPDQRIVIHQVNNGFELNPEVVFNYQQNGINVPGTFTFDNNFGSVDGQAAIAGLQWFPTTNDDELSAIAGDISYDLGGAFTSIDFGVRFSDRESSQFREGVSLGNDGGFYQFAQNNDDEGPSNPFVNDIPGYSPVFLSADQYTIGRFDQEFAGYPDYLVIDFQQALNQFPNVSPNQNRPRDAFFGDNQDFLLVESFTNTEQTIAAYVQGNFNADWGSVPVRGNIGVRYVDTTQDSTGSTILNGQVEPIFNESDYQEVLPSLNVAFELSDSDIVRFAAARVLARPDLLELRAGNTVSVDTNTGDVTGNGGNTQLEPFLADQLDLSYEHYSSNGGIYAIAVFYKDLDSYILPQLRQIDFVAEGFLDPDNVTLNPGVTLDPVGDYTSPVNGSGGYVQGIELAATQTFTGLPYPFDGLGITANYSYTDSSVELPSTESGEAVNITLPGLSENVLNATLFYELGGFETRVGYRYRDEFITRQQGIGEQLPVSDTEQTIDFQATYRFDESSALSGIQLLFQVNNLTDEPLATYFSTPERLSTLGYFGRQYFLGLSYTNN
ncbi:MAG: TonB-dependent receptor [Pseudomonadota bacterium]